MIRGRKVTITAKIEDEAWEDYCWQRDAELMGYSGYPPLTASFPDYFFSALESYPPQPDRLLFSIRTFPEERHIGNCAVYHLDPLHGEAEMGITIGAREYWNQGYGTDAVQALAGFIFTELGLARIYLRTLRSNLRAIRCFEKCGFQPYGELKQESYDFILMELKASAYLARQKQTAAEG